MVVFGVLWQQDIGAIVVIKREKHTHSIHTADYNVKKSEFFKINYSLGPGVCFYIIIVHWIGLDWIIGTFDKQ